MCEALSQATRFCTICCKNIPETEYEQHQQQGCTPLEESLQKFFEMNLERCPYGCGETIPETDVEYHGMLGCTIAKAVGR